MRQAGIREARQNLSALLAEVKDGHEIEITDRGTPVARLVPVEPKLAKPLPDLSALRGRMPSIDPPLSQAVLDERDERDY